MEMNQEEDEKEQQKTMKRRKNKAEKKDINQNDDEKEGETKIRTQQLVEFWFCGNISFAMGFIINASNFINIKSTMNQDEKSRQLELIVGYDKAAVWSGGGGQAHPLASTFTGSRQLLLFLRGFVDQVYVPTSSVNKADLKQMVIKGTYYNSL